MSKNQVMCTKKLLLFNYAKYKWEVRKKKFNAVIANQLYKMF